MRPAVRGIATKSKPSFLFGHFQELWNGLPRLTGQKAKSLLVREPLESVTGPWGDPIEIELLYDELSARRRPAGVIVVHLLSYLIQTA